MNKKLISLLVAICLVIGLLPVMSIAVDPEAATAKLAEITRQGDVILLSPACASWDQYKCFEDRGNEFKNVINSL